MTDQHESTPNPKSFFAVVLIVIGVLWMLLAGLCSGAVLVSSFTGSGRIGEMISMIPIVLLFGTFGAAPGMLIWLGGRALRNRRSGKGG